MSDRLPDVLSPGDLPIAELSSLCLDGELFRVGDCWSPLDVAEDRDQRARSLARLVPVRAIAERLTAAWIHGLAPEPQRHQFCVPITARAYFPPSPRFGVREVVCDPEHIVRLGARPVSRAGARAGGLLVTRPLRTALDLARWPPPELPAPAPLIAALLRLAGHPDTSAARLACAVDSLPYTHRALVHLQAAETAMGCVPGPGLPGPSRR
ncbi:MULTISPECIES: type IV toxin-antitoxin system AbiEi family antitoxin [unclassified Cryobacterium]|uniref:type IV toxin-antitoxin system AbiEi family antitoxin n=1 Tax=unclassified Cryobacterium TaxID=2649013 RepID=UPI002AB5BE3E|nr:MULTISPECIES: hypothetical protein [unclassified Cryobacterium]MDY7544069.1 hypothetical protein [Cryobacterium sp. 5B3]MEA9997925.1 hypothetical protein [Cryobacterium sp. RTS3]MEB0265221.1 hypothetical protein [Cryobacterium sp. 10I5]MEB0273256.1 hypothetical protein [Cryobacterium sp. 5B3]